MEFLLLGAVEARVRDCLVPLGRRRERLLLGILLLDAGKAVPIERLVDLLWMDNPAPAARATLHSHVARLRAVLGPHGVCIATRGPAYVAEVAPAAIDVHRFRHQVERARRTADPRQRADLLRHATSLWRGPLLADAADDRLRDRIGADLAELLLVATEERAEAELECGGHAQVVIDLMGPVATHPTRERLVGLLMLALHRDARQADALAVYGRARDILDEELGLRPGAELASLHQRILRNAPSLDAAVPTPRPDHRRRFLPRDLPDFTGRTAQLDRLDVLAAPSHAAPAIVITAIAGTAGIGKTALAVHWCHRVADRFPDGQLYADLRGYDRRRPETPIEALAALLRTLGVPPEQVPTELDEAAALFRSLLADRKMLLLLDNARSVEQVRPLLPASPTCLVVITSRDALNGLVARDGARRLDLDLMTPDEAVELIGRIVGVERTAMNGPAVAELAAFCGYLPIALGIAAASLAEDPTVTVRAFVDALRERSRLAALEITGDPLSSIQATFHHSVAALPDATQRTFAMLGLAAGVRFDVEAVAVLCDIHVEVSAARLDRLVQAHLVQELSPGRYGLHDLLRDYADELLRKAGDADGDEQARRRLHGWYLGAATAGADQLYPQLVRLPAAADDAGVRPPFETPATARAWLDAEWPNLVIWFHATAERSPRDAWLLADALRGYLWMSRFNSQWHDMATVALRLAEAAGDLAAQGAARISLGDACVNLNDLPAAIAHYGAAAAAGDTAGWPAVRASALHNLAGLHVTCGELDAAEDLLHEAIRLNRAIGRRLGEARNLSQLTVIAADHGRLAEATRLTEQALAIEVELGNPSGRLTDTLALGLLRHLRGDYAGSRSTLLDALAIADELGELRGRFEALITLAALTADLGQTDQARGHADAALLIAHELSDPRVEAPALTLSAMLQRRAGDLDGAERDQLAALSLADRTTDRHPQAIALIELGRLRLDRARPTDALASAGRGNEIARGIGCRLIEADALTVLARAEAALGRPADGEHSARQALHIYRDAGCPVGEARALFSLAVTTGATAYRSEADSILGRLGIPDAATIW